MRKAISILLRVVRRRISKGEILNSILADYPRLTEDEREQIVVAMEG